jgi:hypothetical protein
MKAPGDVSVLKGLYERTPPTSDGEVRMFYAAALVAAGQEAEARQLLTRWPLPENGGDPLFQSLVYPQFLELRRKLAVNH